MSNIQDNNDDLKELLAKSSHKFTNKYTKVLGLLAIGVWLISVGAWYGSHSAANSNQSNSAANFSSLRSSNGASSGGSNFGGGFGGVRASGEVLKVNGSEITIKLDDSTQAGNFKVGDSSRVTNTSGNSGNTGNPTKAAAPNSSKSPNVKASAKPSISSSGNNRQRGGFFSDPKIQACLKKAGVDVTSGTRPDRSDPKVVAALQKCLPNFGQGGVRPSTTP
ncbi:MAG: hypothetical protein RL129_1131 [Actinomycetota bacterium]|jgi:hypothetical protein